MTIQTSAVKKSYIIGIDIGGTDIKAGLFNKHADIIEWTKTASRVKKGKQTVIAKIVQIVEEFEEKHSNIIPVIGIAIAGIIDKKRGIVVHSPNLLNLDNFQIKEELEKTLKKSVIIENDANAAALGELWKGNGRGLKNFMLLTLGTGLGSGLVLDGELWTGEDGIAAEFGHTKIVPDGIKCDCGAKGCLEMYFSSKAIARIVKRILKKETKTVLNSFPAKDAISPKTVYNAASNGDEAAIGVYREISKYLGIAIANVINFLGIKHFILSGGISNAFNIFIPFLDNRVSKNLFYPFRTDFNIVKAKLGNRAGATGAACLVLQHVNRNNSKKVIK